MIQFLLALGGTFYLLHKWTAPSQKPPGIEETSSDRATAKAPQEAPKAPAPETSPQDAPQMSDSELDVEKDVLPAETPQKGTQKVPAKALEFNPFRANQKRQESPYGVRTGSMDDILPTEELDGEEIQEQFGEESDDEAEMD